MSRSHSELMSDGSRPYAANCTGSSTTPNTSAVARSGSCGGISPDAIAALDDGAHHRHRRRRRVGQPAELSVLREDEEPKQHRVLVMRLAESADHRRDFVARVGSAPASVPRRPANAM